MSNKTNEVPSEVPPSPDESAEETKETPRAKTPLEMVRERQAQMRGHQNAARSGSRKSDLSGTANSNKPRMRQRKSG